MVSGGMLGGERGVGMVVEIKLGLMALVVAKTTAEGSRDLRPNLFLTSYLDHLSQLPGTACSYSHILSVTLDTLSGLSAVLIGHNVRKAY